MRTFFLSGKSPSDIPNYYHYSIYLPQPENRIFVLLKLLKLADLSPKMVFKVALADLAPRQLSYVEPRRL